MWRWFDRARPAEPQHVRGEERADDQREVDEHLDQPPPVHGERLERARRSLAARRRSTSARKLANWTSRTKVTSTPTSVEPLVVEDVVGEARRAERGRDQREQEHGVLLGEAEADEPVRGVVAAALRDRPAFEQPDDGHERRVEDRARQGSGSAAGASRRSCRRPSSSRRGRAPRARSRAPGARVAHEDERLPPGRRLNGRKPAQAQRAGEREREDGVVRVDVTASIAKNAKRSGERRREAVHVVEQVERVRHADEPEQRERATRRRALWISCDVRAGREHDHGGGELRSRASRAASSACRSSTRPATKRIEMPPKMPASSVAGWDRAGGDREPEPDAEPGEDADPAEERGRAVVPAVARGGRDEPPLRAGEREEQPDGERGGGESGDRREGAHECRG